MYKIPSLTELLEAGVHFGHQESKGHPKMKPFVYSVSNGVQIINLEKTVEKLKEAMDFLKEQAGQGKTVLFLGTKYQAKKIIRENAEKVKMPYIIERWLGGTITNFSEIFKLIKKLRKLEQDREKGELKKYTKKEQAQFNEEIEKLNKLVGGLKGLERLPDVLFVVDIKKEKTAIREARRLKVPIVAIIDTNVNPEKIDYVIPANDDGIKSLKFIIDLVAEAIEEGVKMREIEEKPKEKPKKEVEKKIKK